MSRDLLVAWAAGFFDGEGTIQVNFNKAGSCSIQVKAYQRIMEPLERMKELYPEGYFDGGSHGGKLFGFIITGHKAGKMLREMLPYLTVKRHQAELVLEILDILPGWSGGRNTPEEKERVRLLAGKVTEAKRPWLREVV